jgi:hypothetical protein
MDMKTYKSDMAAIDGGASVTQARFDELVEFAAKRKIRKPKPASIEVAPKAAKKTAAPKTPKVKGPKAKCDPKSVGSDETCEKDSRSNGLCAAHYSRLVYRADADKAERVRKASRDYAERQRAAKAAAKSADAA